MDGIFFLKTSVPALPANVKGIQLDPVALGFACGGADPHCSTAYSQMWGHYGSVDQLRTKYGIDGKIAFVSFSAGHGFMGPMLNSDKDRSQIDSVILLDSAFGSVQPGYVKTLQDAAAGKLLLVSVTSDKGTKNLLDNGDYAWRQVLKSSGVSLSPSSARNPMPVPESVERSGDFFYYRYRHAQIPHWEMGKLLKPVLEAHALPYLRGERESRVGGWMYWALGIVTVAAGTWIWKNRPG